MSMIASREDLADVKLYLVRSIRWGDRLSLVHKKSRYAGCIWGTECIIVGDCYNGTTIELYNSYFGWS